MNNVFCFIIFITLHTISSTFFKVYAAENNYDEGYIIDKLSTFIHTGPSTNYRILGSVTAGASIKITGLQENNYSEIIDDKSRKAWIETKYVTKNPGLRINIVKLNEKISNNNSFTSQLDGQINTLTSKVNTLLSEKKALTNELQVISEKLSQTRAKVNDQNTNIKKQWFFTGAAVLGVGLVLGLILPRLLTRKRNTMQSWS